MNLDQFVQKYNMKALDFDGSFGAQCVDLVQFYAREVLGTPRFTGNAVDIWNTYSKDHFDRIVNGPINVPQKGDIVIWSEGIGKFGHIAVFVDGNVMKFNSFDQNFPVGSKCHIQPHSYKAVLGWLRKKGSSELSPQELVDKTKEILRSNDNSFDKEFRLKQLYKI